MDKDRKYKMNRKQLRYKWFIYIMLFSIMFLGTELGFSFYHEGVHGAIYDQYGVNYTYGFMFDPDMFYAPAFYTQAVDSSYQLCNEVCGSLQTENEIISYNMRALSYTIWSLFIFWLFMKFVEERAQVDDEEEPIEQTQDG